MFGSLIGSIVSAPIRVAGGVMRAAESVADASAELLIGEPAPKRREKNEFEDLADEIQDSVKEMLDD